MDQGWWLDRPLNGATKPSPLVRAEIIRIAIDVLDDDSAKLELVAQACMILADGADPNAEQRERVLAAINRRLIKLCETKRALTTVVATHRTGAGFLSLALPADSEFLHFIPMIPSSEPPAYLCLELLDVVGALEGQELVRPGLEAVSKATLETRESLALGDSNKTDQDRRRLLCHWATSSLFAEPYNPFIRSQEQYVWGTHKPTQEDWLIFIILNHPVMEEFLLAPAQHVGTGDPTQ